MPRRNKRVKQIKPLQISNCDPKRRYPTERQAREVAEYQMLINCNLSLSVYQCDLCHKWHLTREMTSLG